MADKRTVVATDGGGGGAGMIVAVVLLLVVIVGLFLAFQNGVFSGAGTQDINADVKIETPKTN